MEEITLEELEENFDEILDRVEEGEEFKIVVDGEDKAVIRPYSEDPFERYERTPQEEGGFDRQGP